MKKITIKRAAVAVALSLAIVAGISFIATTTHAATISIWPSSVTPATVDSDPASVELGTKFRSSVAGSVTGVRFYKGAGNTGTHTGTLWSKAGAKLASVTFTGETATGWQQASFATPVAITANTTYVISYHAPSGHYSADESYFASQAATNGPLTALQNGTDGKNGVYKYGSVVAFPNASYNSTNYWVDAIFSYTDTPADTTPPTVNTTTPVSNATDIATTTPVTATFSEALDAATTTSALTVKNTSGTAIAGTTVYDNPTRTITFTPTAELASGQTYSVTVDTSVKDIAGNPLAAAITWSFTTKPAPIVSLWAPASQTVSTALDDSSAVDLGTRFTSDQAGTVSSLLFYKSSDDAPTHRLSLWDQAGNILASATTATETTTGWQTATLTTPIAISAGATYTVSYHAPAGHYSYTSGTLADGYSNGPLHVPAGGGVYTYTAGHSLDQSFGNTNYWADVTFNPGATPPPDTTAPTVATVNPAASTTDVKTTATISATLSEAIDPATVAGAISVKDSTGATLAGTTSYDAASDSLTFIPSGLLATSTSYTATVAASVRDTAGNALAVPYVWSFTTAAPAAGTTDLTKGPGGPILVLNSAAQPFSTYYAEILRTEGLNSFDASDIATVNAAQLARYDVVILGNVSVSDQQVSLLTDWVNAGGNLVAMHPDKKLANLLGLVDQSSSLSDRYIKVDTTAAPGAGIVADTMQYHGSADIYSLQAGTRAVANLYSSATTGTTSPAVTVRSVGTNGGHASAFTYDLAQSVVNTHQGNPAWAGQDRDGNGVIRPNDLFYGNKTGDVQPDYVDLNKVAIPQADEQQRLLANTIEYMNRDHNPLPKFWYFPNGKKAVMVMAGDDHATPSGTKDTFDYMLANSPAGCSVANWQCLRATSWMYTSGPMTNEQAGAYEAQGFDLGVHVSTGCADWTPAQLNDDMTNDLAAFRAKFPTLPAQTGSRTHCITWSDYISTPLIELAHGIRADFNYYYWPGSWVQNRPGYFTGSGMDMRFADQTGAMIDVYQMPSHLVNESGQDFPSAINTQLDRALGPEGYYGAIGTHFDYSDSFAQQLITASVARGVPVVSVQQMLDWVDGRNASSLSSATWLGNTLNFSATVDAKVGTMLRGMLPVSSIKGNLSAITEAGTAVSYTTEVIKGIEYAMYPVSTGDYSATYTPDTTPPTMTTSTPASGATDVTTQTNITATFSEALDETSVSAATVSLQDANGVAVSATVSYSDSNRQVVITPTTILGATQTYTVTLNGGTTGIKDVAGNTLASSVSWNFTTGITRLSLWTPTLPTVSVATGDTARVELGLQFTSDIAGKISGISYYKSVNDAAQHTMTLWDAAGVALGSATTANETASGWQTASFAQPITITAGAVYTASYTAAQGQYSYASGDLTNGFTNGHLKALANGGVFTYGTGVPNNSFNGTNYWIDVILNP